MATGQFEVDTDFLRRNTNELSQYLQTLKKVQAELTDKMSELSAMWKGPAKDAFHSQFDADCADFLEICKKLDEAINSVGTAAKEYDICDSKVKNVIDAIVI